MDLDNQLVDTHLGRDKRLVDILQGEDTRPEEDTQLGEDIHLQEGTHILEEDIHILEGDIHILVEGMIHSVGSVR